MKFPTFPAPLNEPRLPTTIGGVAGLAGGSLIVIATLFSSSGLLIVGLILLAVCELALVTLLVWVNRAAVGCAVIALATGVFVGALGVASGNLLIAPGYVAIGLLCWIVVAPLVAVLASQAGLIPLPPAVALAAATAIWLVSSLSALAANQTAVVVIVGSYCVSWSWLGVAMLRAGHLERGRN